MTSGFDRRARVLVHVHVHVHKKFPRKQMWVRDDPTRGLNGSHRNVSALSLVIHLVDRQLTRQIANEHVEQFAIGKATG